MDVYLSGFVLSYFLVTTVFQPRRTTHHFLGFALFIIVAFIAVLRVRSILGV